MSASHSSHGHGSSSHFEPHVLPLKVYFGVWGALLFLTFITVAVSYFDFGPFNLFVAMAVATFKAGLVATFFMHLKYDDKLNAAVFISSLLFIFIFFFLTMADTFTRGVVDSKSQGVFLNKHGKQPAAAAPAPAHH